MVADICSSHVQPPTLPSMCVSALGLLADLCGDPGPSEPTPADNMYVQHPPQYAPCYPGTPAPAAREVAVLPPPTETPTYGITPVLTCTSTTAAKSSADTKVRVVVNADSQQLEMSVGDDACMSCKKMIVKLGDNELSLTRSDDRVCVRMSQLKAKADCVRTDRKDRLILEGNAVLHYCKDGQCADVTADRIELNLSNGSVTIKPSATMERIGVNFR